MRKIVLIFVAALMGFGSVAYAEEAPIETPEVIVVELVPTPTPIPLTPPPATPTPTPRPDLPNYSYDDSDARALSRGLWSVCPASPTRATKIAFCELVQNRVDDNSGDFEDTVYKVLRQGGEFLDFDSDAYRSRENNEIADYVMRSWIYESVTGDRSYRLTPEDGLYCDFYRQNGWDFIKIYNRAGDIVYDSGTLK